MSNGRNFVAAVVCAAAAWSTQASGALLLDFENDSDDLVRFLRLSPSGGIFAEIAFGATNRCGILSLDPDGVPNTVFDQDGRLALDTCPPDLRVQPDGSLVLLESATATAKPSIRVRSPSGAVLMTSPELYPFNELGLRYSPRILSPQADGAYLVGGNTRSCITCFKWFLGRFNADGSRDTTFGPGAGEPVFGLLSEVLESVHPLSGGKILLSGRADGPKVLVMRLNADGSVDSSFGSNGKVQLSGSIGFSVLDATGRLYLLKGQGVVARILADGSLDPSYVSGTVQPGVTIHNMAIDTLGRVVLFGEKTDLGYVSRFDASGNPDTTFNGTGEVLVTFPRPLPSHSPLDGRCFGAIQSGNQPLLACPVQAEADAGVTARNDVGIVRLTSAGVLDPTFGAGQPDPDSYPDPITFPDVTAPYGTAWVQSATQTVGGFTDPARIETNGVQYSIGCTGTFTESSGVISSGQTICLRRPAPLQPGDSSVASVIIGGRKATFTVIAGNSPADYVPDPFSFVAQSDVALGATVTSNVVTITGITGVVTASVVNGSYSVGCTQNFVTSPTSITNGASICVRHVASTSPSTSTSTQLKVSSVSATFSSTTVAADTTPDAFAFTDQTGITPGAIVVSNAVTITGIDSAANVTVTSGEFSIGCNGTFTSTAGSIQSGQSVCVRHTAASTASTRITTTLTIGAVSGGFSSTTAAAAAESSGGGNGSNGGGGGGAVDRWMLVVMSLFALLVHRTSRRRPARM